MVLWYNNTDLASLWEAEASTWELFFFFFFKFNFPGGSDGKESACNVGDLGSILGLGRSPGEVDNYPLQYSGLENSMDRGAWWATVHKVTKSQTQVSDLHTSRLIGGPVVKNLPACAGDAGSVSGLGRFPGEGNGNPLQYSCLENRIRGRGPWGTAGHWVWKESDMTGHTCPVVDLFYNVVPISAVQ